jgi:hypothetical protein
MNQSSIKASLQQLSIEGLYLFVRDVEHRIGSHVAGGDPVEEYIEKQKALLTYVQEELERREYNAK